jgi:acyl-CoA thioesterase
VSCLSLRGVEPGLVEGDNLDIGYYRVFGGQILAQVIAAAASATPAKRWRSCAT